MFFDKGKIYVEYFILLKMIRKLRLHILTKRCLLIKIINICE